jgi:ribosome recycling factor
MLMCQTKVEIRGIRKDAIDSAKKLKGRICDGVEMIDQIIIYVMDGA